MAVAGVVLGDAAGVIISDDAGDSTGGATGDQRASAGLTEPCARAARLPIGVSRVCAFGSGQIELLGMSLKRAHEPRGDGPEPGGKRVLVAAEERTIGKDVVGPTVEFGHGAPDRGRKLLLALRHGESLPSARTARVNRRCQ